jgi:hypothetical protein
MKGIPPSSCQPKGDSVSQCSENKFGAREINSLFNLKFLEIFQAATVNCLFFLFFVFKLGIRVGNYNVH